MNTMAREICKTGVRHIWRKMYVAALTEQDSPIEKSGLRTMIQ